jgi:hypothetical protein
LNPVDLCRVFSPSRPSILAIKVQKRPFCYSVGRSVKRAFPCFAGVPANAFIHMKSVDWNGILLETLLAPPCQVWNNAAHFKY